MQAVSWLDLPRDPQPAQRAQRDGNCRRGAGRAEGAGHHIQGAAQEAHRRHPGEDRHLKKIPDHLTAQPGHHDHDQPDQATGRPSSPPSGRRSRPRYPGQPGAPAPPPRAAPSSRARSRSQAGRSRPGTRFLPWLAARRESVPGRCPGPGSRARVAPGCSVVNASPMLRGTSSIRRSVIVFFTSGPAVAPGSASAAPRPGCTRFVSVRPISMATSVLMR